MTAHSIVIALPRYCLPKGPRVLIFRVSLYYCGLEGGLQMI